MRDSMFQEEKCKVDIMWTLCVPLYHHGSCLPAFLSYRKHEAKYERVFVENRIRSISKISQAFFMEAFWNTLYRESYLMLRDLLNPYLYLKKDSLFHLRNKKRAYE